MHPVFFYKPSPPPAYAGWRWWFNVWTPAAIAVAVICAESTDTFSSNNTSSWLRPIVQQLLGALQDSTWAAFHHYLRKTGHFVGYAAVAFTFLRAWLYTLDRRAPRSLSKWRIQSTLRALASPAIVASCDEYHQSFIPSRTASPYDVLLDTVGACVLCLIVWLLCWTRQPQAESREGLRSNAN